MKADGFALLALIGGVLTVSAVAADTQLLTLSKNPFTRPPVLNLTPPPAPPKIVKKAEPVQLELSATMMSNTSPMVIADGELLAVGDSIKGLKLVEVMEGKAVFVAAGKRVTFSIDDKQGN
jgi:hypothetical protein